MKIEKCQMGHFYDSEKYYRCPHCKNEKLSLLFDDYLKQGDMCFIRSDKNESVYSITPKPKYYLRKIKFSDEETKNKILHEVDIRNRLKGCSHIIQIESFFEETNEIYVIEEYYTSFAEYRKKSQLKYKDFFDLADQIIHALIECRDKGVFHLDINPNNIFIDNSGIYKLGNFCSAELYDKVLSKELKNEYFHGNISYIAPEVFTESHYSEQSEIYSLGITLYDLLNDSSLPFMFEMPLNEANSQRISGKEIPEPVGGTDKMKSFVLKACAYDIKSRFTSYKHFSKELKKLRKTLTSEEFERDISSDYTKDITYYTFTKPTSKQDYTFPRNSIADKMTSDSKDGFQNTLGMPVYNNGQSLSNTNNSKPDIYSVQFSAIAPKTITNGKYAMIDIVMYEEAYRTVVDRLKLNREEDEKIQEKESGFLDVEKNTMVRIVLSTPDIDLNDETEERVWKGKFLGFNFAVSIPMNYSKKEILFIAKVYFNGIIVTKLKFVVQMFSLTEQRIAVTKKNILSAFVSYASQDRSRVAAILQGIMKVRPEMDIFFDVESLRSGQKWEEALWNELDKSDILYLCWSLSARNSKWVEREWKYFLEKKGIDCIEPLPIDPPDICPPPYELRNKYFNDRMLYLIKR